MTIEELLRESLVRYDIPEHMHDGVIMYVLHRYLPGHFLTALMSNDLHDAFVRADDSNIAAMFQWVKWFHNEAPSPCWGSPEKVRDWVIAGRIERQKQSETIERTP